MRLAEQLLKKIYYDPSAGFVSVNKLFKKLKEIEPSITYEQTKKFLEKQYTYQVNKDDKKPKEYASIIAPHPRANYQIDILVYDRYESNKYKYILVVVDVHSRYAEARAMTSRENPTVVKHLTDIFESMGYPKNVNADQEFASKQIMELLQQHSITPHISETGQINKNAIVERLNRTIAGILQKWRQATKKREWYKVLPQIMGNYNNTFHRSIKAKPSDVFTGKDTNNQRIVPAQPMNLKIGDRVRIKQVKTLLGKGDFVKYSEEVYRITDITKNRVKLEDTETGQPTKRSYKMYELKPALEVQYLEDSEGNYEMPKEREVMDEKRKERRLKKELAALDNPQVLEGRRIRKPKMLD